MPNGHNVVCLIGIVRFLERCRAPVVFLARYDHSRRRLIRPGSSPKRCVTYHYEGELVRSGPWFKRHQVKLNLEEVNSVLIPPRVSPSPSPPSVLQRAQQSGIPMSFYVNDQSALAGDGPPEPCTPVRRASDSGLRSYNPSLGRWLSRDPIAERSFLLSFVKNRSRSERRAIELASLGPEYLFVSNSPILYYDENGLFPGVAVGLIGLAADLACLLSSQIAGIMSYPTERDKVMRHCWTSCFAARTCGLGFASFAGWSHEQLEDLLDKLGFGYSVGEAGRIADTIVDLANNAAGLSCAGGESTIPLVGGNIGRWFRQSCECCCKNSPSLVQPARQ